MTSKRNVFAASFEKKYFKPYMDKGSSTDRSVSAWVGDRSSQVHTATRAGCSARLRLSIINNVSSLLVTYFISKLCLTQHEHVTQTFSVRSLTTVEPGSRGCHSAPCSYDSSPYWQPKKKQKHINNLKVVQPVSQQNLPSSTKYGFWVTWPGRGSRSLCGEWGHCLQQSSLWRRTATSLEQWSGGQGRCLQVMSLLVWMGLNIGSVQSVH